MLPATSASWASTKDPSKRKMAHATRTVAATATGNGTARRAHVTTGPRMNANRIAIATGISKSWP
jgi:hypothetical protein